MDEEGLLMVRGLALHAAASALSTVAVLADRGGSVLLLAQRLEQWLLRPMEQYEADAVDGM